VILIGYLQWAAYWGINSVVVRTVQTLYPESTAGKTLSFLQ
jgi:hypothetical protein